MDASIACSVFTIEKRSTSAPPLPRLRSPAVSTSVYCLPARRNGTSIGSRVVPGVPNAITRSSPTSALTSVDLPTFGLPTIATRGCPSSRSAAAGSSSGKSASTASRSSLTPSPCAAEIGAGTPMASSWNSATALSAARPSLLLTASQTRRPSLRRRAAIARSPGARPARASVTKITASASAIACSVWRAISEKMPSGVSGSSPPVSIAMNGRPPSRPSP